MTGIESTPPVHMSPAPEVREDSVPASPSQSIAAVMSAGSPIAADQRASSPVVAKDGAVYSAIVEDGAASSAAVEDSAVSSGAVEDGVVSSAAIEDDASASVAAEEPASSPVAANAHDKPISGKYRLVPMMVDTLTGEIVGNIPDDQVLVKKDSTASDPESADTPAATPVDSSAKATKRKRKAKDESTPAKKRSRKSSDADTSTGRKTGRPKSDEESENMKMTDEEWAVKRKAYEDKVLAGPPDADGKKPSVFTCEFAGGCRTGQVNAKECRYCVSDYFGRNKRATAMIPRPIQWCRKHYQRAAFQAKTWPLIKVCLIKIMQHWLMEDFIASHKKVMTFTVQLKRSEKIRMSNYNNAVASKMDIPDNIHPEGRVKGNLAPVAALQHMFKDFLGPNKSYEHCQKVLIWVEQELRAGRLTNIPNFEMVPEWPKEVVAKEEEVASGAEDVEDGGEEEGHNPEEDVEEDDEEEEVTPTPKAPKTPKSTPRRKATPRKTPASKSRVSPRGSAKKTSASA
ncbi:hypothetical protein EJ08DRAFT_644698 [Tothia fuscella]|uniref:Uncharacterized protein n=1 Tax=Tothia fuscella TaxID=1048955 RepID=A0A9P4P302_9PEZI|nr:hypothetical protein EJ08DRAFT_644698 [Tothia fuscella]